MSKHSKYHKTYPNLILIADEMSRFLDICAEGVRPKRTVFRDNSLALLGITTDRAQGTIWKTKIKSILA